MTHSKYNPLVDSAVALKYGHRDRVMSSADRIRRSDQVRNASVPVSEETIMQLAELMTSYREIVELANRTPEEEARAAQLKAEYTTLVSTIK